MNTRHLRKHLFKTPSAGAGPNRAGSASDRVVASGLIPGAIGAFAADMRRSRSFAFPILMAVLFPAGALTAAAILIAPSARATEGGANSAAVAPTGSAETAAARTPEAPKETAGAGKQYPAAAPKKEEKAERDHPVHDFSRLTGRDEDSCSACHIPHVQTGAETAGNQAAGDLFKIARQRPVLAVGRYAPGPTSMICLTCHNGSIAVSTVGTAQAARDASSCSVLGWPPRFAMRDHPIGVPYPDRRKGFRPKARVEASGKIKLPEGRVECISCHDQHQEEDWPHLLVMSNKRSALCLSCHQK